MGVYDYILTLEWLLLYGVQKSWYWIEFVFLKKKYMLYKWIIRDLVIIAVYFYCAFHTKWCFMGVIFFSGWVFQICVIFQLLFNTPLHDEKPVKKVRIIITVQK